MRTLYPVLKYLAVLLWSVFVVFPFLWALTTSFKDANGVTGGATWIPWVQYEPSVAGWRALFGGAGGVNGYFGLCARKSARWIIPSSEFRVPSSKFQVPSSKFSPPQALCECACAP